MGIEITAASRFKLATLNEVLVRLGQGSGSPEESSP